MGPLRELLWSGEVPRPPLRRRAAAYAVPLGLLALIGLGFAAAEYLSDTRVLPQIVIVIMAIGSVLQAAVAYRYPTWGWRVGFVMLFVGAINATPREVWPWNPVQIPLFLLVMFRLAGTRGTAVTVWATVLSLVPAIVYPPGVNKWGPAVLLVAVAAIGDIVYRRRRTRQLIAEKEELTELERAKRAVLEERTRIAREMHDVVAHHMSMIAVRAETAPFRLTGLAEPAQQELAAIATAAREALSEMRRLLGVLRAEEETVRTAPQPGLADLAELVETARSAGVPVTLALPEVSIPETAGLAAYRIVQEALANAARHAPGQPVSVDVRVRPDALEIAVRNRLVARVAAGTTGHGLVGMRERATLLGGSLTATSDESDFVVLARLPLESAS
ncbi:two-component sensor histidine kinase [Actinoplanes sp. TBRC 11911]|uniref:sensor histidine kinase n=1 Tax=Actinoplanes sp. TBRC 11911 TaxID=2729386 RepID=UPI00145EAF7C|nr:histidine kinase [Actinoplanes sp. TBRC 11911]NMO57075.1 two-component sensor histidine kinase [Actinoplanes sp. TBRC 11911]